MVALALIGVRDGEGRHCLVEGVALTEVPADLRGSAGAGVSARQRPGADLDVLRHDTRSERLDERSHLHVAELADIAMPAEFALRPAEEDVAGRLHESVAVHDPLSVIGVDGL